MFLTNQIAYILKTMGERESAEQFTCVMKYQRALAAFRHEVGVRKFKAAHALEMVVCDLFKQIPTLYNNLQFVSGIYGDFHITTGTPCEIYPSQFTSVDQLALGMVFSKVMTNHHPLKDIHTQPLQIYNLATKAAFKTAAQPLCDVGNGRALDLQAIRTLTAGTFLNKIKSMPCKVSSQGDLHYGDLRLDKSWNYIETIRDQSLCGAFATTEISGEMSSFNIIREIAETDDVIMAALISTSTAKEQDNGNVPEVG